jgi:thymidylate synthase
MAHSKTPSAHSLRSRNGTRKTMLMKICRASSPTQTRCPTQDRQSIALRMSSNELRYPHTQALININRASNSELKNAISEVKSWKAKLEGDIDTQCNGLSNDITPILKDDYCHIKEEIIKQNEENDQISKVVKNLKKSAR